MAKISLKQIKAAYALASQVNDGQLKREAAAAHLHEQHDLNINSARDFITQYRSMIRGVEFKRSLSAEALRYFLAQILQERGREASENAITAVRKHIKYFERIEKSQLLKLRSILKNFEESLSGLIDLEFYERKFWSDVRRSQRGSTSARNKRLELACKIPIVTMATAKVYIRNPDVAAAVLERAAGICEQCKEPAPFQRKSDQTPYLEVHHKVQHAHGGEDSVENAIALCPNCHRHQHYG